MDKITPRILKGFRDFLPSEMRKRQYVIDIIKRTFELWGFEPIETPALEYLDIFKGNIGEDEKLFYKFKDEGGREVALRYDQTVPTCRVVAQYPDKITFPFKRYQIQPSWRAEKPQKGRFREFLQADVDIFGLNNPESDAEVIALTIDVFKALGFKKPIALINDRSLYKEVPYKAIVVIDKLEKIGEEKVLEELQKNGYSKDAATLLLQKINNLKPNDNLMAIFRYLDDYSLRENYRFQPTLARSFSYSTGTIWEIIVEGFTAGSLAGGERFDKLVGRFFKKDIPAVGVGIGLDRIIVAMQEFGLFPTLKTKTKVLVISLDKSLLSYSLDVARKLRQALINTDFYSNPDEKLNKKLKYADKKEISWVVIIGKDEKEKDLVKLKNMQTGKQESLSLTEAIAKIR